MTEAAEKHVTFSVYIETPTLEALDTTIVIKNLSCFQPIK